MTKTDWMGGLKKERDRQAEREREMRKNGFKIFLANNK